jgi:choline-sulfatase
MKRISQCFVWIITLVIFISGCINYEPKEKPNIIYIFTDQQSATMMSCAGNKWINTPAMDYIAKNGVRFTRAYATNPVCSPSRVSLMTGRFPGYFNDDKGNEVKDNSGAMRIPFISEEVRKTTIASLMKNAGYELVYGGKEHLPQPFTPTALGFNDICNDERDDLAQRVAEYIRGKHEKPYFLVVSFINPHDICYMRIRDFAHTEKEKQLVKWGQVELATLDEALKIPDNVSEDEFFRDYCPPLPLNFEPQQNEPLVIDSFNNQWNFQKISRKKYREKDWRMYRWAYSRLTEDVDRQIQILLDALKESGQEEKTLVLFSSDHGDMNASHRLGHKSVLYEESANIPFIAMMKGHLPAPVVDSVHLVSNHLDLLPTVCDYAGIKGVADPRGMSLRPLLEGNKELWRNTLGAESEIGKMVVDAGGYKYIRYNLVGTEESLIDLNIDPFEQKQFTNYPDYNAKLNELRQNMDSLWFPQNKK